MRLTIAYSKIKKRNLVFINNDTYQRETLAERPIRQPLTRGAAAPLNFIPLWDVTAYFISGRTETCAFLSVHVKIHVWLKARSKRWCPCRDTLWRHIHSGGGMKFSWYNCSTFRVTCAHDVGFCFHLQLQLLCSWAVQVQLYFGPTSFVESQFLVLNIDKRLKRPWTTNTCPCNGRKVCCHWMIRFCDDWIVLLCKIKIDAN